jgi:hypothetical protein
MTWLSISIAITLTSALAGLVVLIRLGASLKAQGDDTDRQMWNRRMLAIGGSLYGAAILLSYLLLGELLGGPILLTGSVLALPVVVLGLLVGGMVCLRFQGRVIVTLLFVVFCVVAGVLIPVVHRGPYEVLFLYMVSGLVLAKLTRVAIGLTERQKQLS